jgi:tyrosyl-tRNA synthetase
MFTRGVKEVIHMDEFVAMLAEGRSLRVKCGFDPTSSDLHLGHAVLLRKLREFQDAGHEVTFLIGDFTAKIGDPTGRNKLRPPLSDDDIARNTDSFLSQVFRILRQDVTRVRFNSEWFGKDTAAGLIKLMSSVTVNQMLQRDGFSGRFEREEAIHLHELVYPLLQGMDSVMLDCDVELGGIDQKFNLLMGRELQKKHRQRPQTIMMMPLLIGTDGVQKMSKSLDNHIGITESPNEQFAKLMSIPDDILSNYATLLTDIDISTEQHPMESKKAIAHAVVTAMHNRPLADMAQLGWETQFQKRGAPPEMERVQVSAGSRVHYDEGWIVRLDRVLVSAGLAISNKEANRKIKEGAVCVDGINWKGRGNGFWIPKQLPVTKILRLGRNWRRVEVLD